MKKTALITGSSAGIGAEIAFQLSQNNIEVFLTGRNEARLIEQAAKCSTENYLAGDLSSKGFCDELFNIAINKLGHIDILVNNAGAYIWSPIEKTDVSKINQIFKLNLEIPYRLTMLTVPGMKNQNWGRIISIGSISGAVGEANASLYSASKAGLTGLTKSLALELAEFGITINLINPGWVKTGLIDPFLADEIIDESEQIDMIPQKRWIEPSEIASLVNYLISENARGMTGQAINLCAGLSLG